MYLFQQLESVIELNDFKLEMAMLS